MPTYESICLKCGKYFSYFETINGRNNTPECCKKKTSKRIITAPSGIFDIAPWDSFESPSTGKLITSKKERMEDMKASGCREWEGMAAEKKRAATIKAEDEAKQDAAIDATVRKAWAQLPASKRAKALKEANQ